jgi:hypothetical protein
MNGITFNLVQITGLLVDAPKTGELRHDSSANSIHQWMVVIEFSQYGGLFISLRCRLLPAISGQSGP